MTFVSIVRFDYPFEVQRKFVAATRSFVSVPLTVTFVHACHNSQLANVYPVSDTCIGESECRSFAQHDELFTKNGKK
jgi:hypothetical protein